MFHCLFRCISLPEKSRDSLETCSFYVLMGRNQVVVRTLQTLQKSFHTCPTSPASLEKTLWKKEIHIARCVLWLAKQLSTQTFREAFTCFGAAGVSSSAQAASSAPIATGKQSYLLFQNSIVLFSILIKRPRVPCSVYFKLTHSIPGKLWSSYYIPPYSALLIITQTLTLS